MYIYIYIYTYIYIYIYMYTYIVGLLDVRLVVVGDLPHGLEGGVAV